MKKTILNILVCAMCTLLIAGCGGQGGSGRPAGPTKKADTPKQALENMRLALLAGDRDAYVNCFDATEKEGEALGAMCDLATATGDLKQAVKETYGEEAAKELGGPNPASEMAAEEWIDAVTIKIDGDKATVQHKDQEPLDLVRKEGEWKISAGEMLGRGEVGDEDIETMTGMFQAMTKAVGTVRPKVGQAGYTAEKINQELGQAMMMAMFSQMPKDAWSEE